MTLTMTKNNLVDSIKYRKKIHINESGLENTIFKVAENISEYEAAYRMAHDLYVQRGYMDSNASGMRLSLFNSIPNTTTFIGKTNDQVSVAGSLFIDSLLGLPLDSLYKKEVDELRNKRRKIVEFGSIVSSKFNTNAMMHLFKIMFKYAREYLSTDDIVITVNPKHSNFYEYIIGFVQIGETLNYSYVKNNPAVAYRLDLNTSENFLWNNYPRHPIENDIHNFFYVENSSKIILPANNMQSHGWTQEVYEHFSDKIVDLFGSKQQRYKLIFDSVYKKTDTIN